MMRLVDSQGCVQRPMQQHSVLSRLQRIMVHQYRVCPEEQPRAKRSRMACKQEPASKMQHSP